MATYNGHQEDASGNILLSIGNGMTATLETGSTASQAYTKGAYIFFNNKLCKASTAITSGATLAIGTNLTQTSIGAELSSHLRATNGDEFYFDYKDGKAGYYPSASKTSSEFVPFGGTIDFGNPITSGYGTQNKNSTYTITLPSGWQFLSFIATRTNNENRVLVVYDRKNDIGQTRTDTGVPEHSISEITSSSAIFTSITDTSVVITRFSTSYSYAISYVAF